jgi:hypothetical protein
MTETKNKTPGAARKHPVESTKSEKPTAPVSGTRTAAAHFRFCHFCF